MLRDKDAHDAAARVLIFGSGHLAYRIRKLAAEQGLPSVHRAPVHRSEGHQESEFDVIARTLHDVDLTTISRVVLVDDSDERNLELLIALISFDERIPVVASMFNENIAPHLNATHPRVRILNPARIAAAAFVAALDTPINHSLRYIPARIPDERPTRQMDPLILTLSAAFLSLLGVATTYFHFAEHVSWLDALYFVVVTMATVGYGDISLRDSSALSKMVGIALILTSTVFIWMIFSLTVDHLIKQRVQLGLGRKRYQYRNHVILCGLGRLGYFIGEGLLDRGERVIIVERNENSPTIDHFRRRGADVYIGDARLPRVLQDVGVTNAKALYSVINNDFANLEVGLNARTFDPSLRLILRIFDGSTAQRLKQNLDIHLTFSMTAIVDELFLTVS